MTINPQDHALELYCYKSFAELEKDTLYNLDYYEALDKDHVYKVDGHLKTKQAHQKSKHEETGNKVDVNS